MGSQSSRAASVGAGVPQGSVLGPLLFVYYINSVVQEVDGCGVIMYADDIAIYSSHRNISILEERLQNALNGVYDWCVASKLTINVDKSKTVLYANSSRSPVMRPLRVLMGGWLLESVTSYTYLGVHLDSRLSYEKTISELISKVNNRLFNLTAIRPLISRGTALVIYKTSVATLFDYASFFYVAANEGLLLKLQRLQNRGLRTCLNTATCVYSVEQLHSMSSTSELSRRWDELMLTLMLKYYRRDHADWLDRVNSDTVGSLRSQSKMLFGLKRPVTEGYKRSPCYHGKMLWNVQPEWLKLSVSKGQFKRNLRQIEDLREKYPKKGYQV